MPEKLQNRNSGRFHSTGKYCYPALFYCTTAHKKHIPIKEYASLKNLSVAQVKTLLRKREVSGIKFRNRMYVWDAQL